MFNLCPWCPETLCFAILCIIWDIVVIFVKFEFSLETSKDVVIGLVGKIISFQETFVLGLRRSEPQKTSIRCKGWRWGWWCPYPKLLPDPLLSSPFSPFFSLSLTSLLAVRYKECVFLGGGFLLYCGSSFSNILEVLMWVLMQLSPFLYFSHSN